MSFAGTKLLGLALIVLAGCRPASPGALVVIGGRLEPDNHAVFEAMLSRRDGPGPICVIPTASGEPNESMAETVEDFRRYGGADSAKGVAIAAGDVAATTDPDLATALRGCSGFFFTGGDQSRIVDTFIHEGQRSLAYTAMVERHRAGAFIAGTSAGAAMMGRLMIGSGDSGAALDHGICDADGCPGVWVRAGMGFWPEWVTDQHFLARDRVGRLLVALLELPDGPRKGLGVDEDTGVIVEGDLAEVVGRSGAMVIDATDARRRDSTWSGIQLSLFGPGDRFRLSDGALVSRAAKPANMGESSFEDGAFVDVLVEMGRATNPTSTTVDGDAWSVIVTPSPTFSASIAETKTVGHVGPFVLEVSLPPR